MVMDWLYAAGQALSALGLAYGCYLSTSGAHIDGAAHEAADSIPTFRVRTA